MLFRQISPRRLPPRDALAAATLRRDAAALDAAAAAALPDEGRRASALHAHEACARLCVKEADGFADAFRPTDAPLAAAACLALAGIDDATLFDAALVAVSASGARALLPALPLLKPAPPASPPRSSGDRGSFSCAPRRSASMPPAAMRSSFGSAPRAAAPPEVSSDYARAVRSTAVGAVAGLAAERGSLTRVSEW